MEQSGHGASRLKHVFSHLGLEAQSQFSVHALRGQRFGSPGASLDALVRPPARATRAQDLPRLAGPRLARGRHGAAQDPALAALRDEALGPLRRGPLALRRPVVGRARPQSAGPLRPVCSSSGEASAYLSMVALSTYGMSPCTSKGMSLGLG